MTDAELVSLILTLQSSTPLSRVNLAEAKVIFAKLAELGYVLAKPATAVTV